LAGTVRHAETVGAALGGTIHLVAQLALPALATLAYTSSARDLIALDGYAVAIAIHAADAAGNGKLAVEAAAVLVAHTPAILNGTGTVAKRVDVARSASPRVVAQAIHANPVHTGRALTLGTTAGAITSTEGLRAPNALEPLLAVAFDGQWIDAFTRALHGVRATKRTLTRAIKPGETRLALAACLYLASCAGVLLANTMP